MHSAQNNSHRTPVAFDETAHADLRATNALGMHRDLGGCADCRTPAVAAILDLVRDTGKSAHPQQGERVSELVYAWSTLNGRNPIEVQAEVERYADFLDAGDEPDEPDSTTIERGYDPYGRAQ